MKKYFVAALLLILLSACAAPTPASVGVTPAVTSIPVTGATQPVVSTVAPSINAPTTVASTQPMMMETPTTAATEVMAMETPTTVTTQAAVPVTGAQTYTVLVGGEDTNNAAELMAYFPSSLKIHVGDTVLWKLNSMEFHTVSFLAGQTLPEFTIPVPNAPQGAMMFNPLAAFPAGPADGMYDGTGLVNSGIMGTDQGQVKEYRLTFTKAGSYPYVCIIHGQPMSGTVEVVDASSSIPSPDQVTAQGKQELDALVAKIPAAVSAAQALVQPDTKNADGSTTHHVMVGYYDNQIDLMSFFPSQLNVKSGDTVVWNLGPKDTAPHTVTFLNGAEEPPIVVVQPVPNAQPLMLINPAMAVPQNVGKPLTNQGIFNSGMMVPNTPAPQSFTLKVGNMSGELSYLCLLHDTMGMKGSLIVSQ